MQWAPSFNLKCRFDNCLLIKRLAVSLGFSFLSYTVTAQLENGTPLIISDSLAIAKRFEQIENKVREGSLDLDGQIAAYEKLLALSEKSNLKIGVLVALKNLRSYY